METTGTVHFKSDIQQKSDKFKMIEIVISDTSNSQYPQYISFQVVNDRCSLIDDIHNGDNVKVQFNIRGRQWTSPAGEVKYFNTLEIWKIEKINNSTSHTVKEAVNNTVVNSNDTIDKEIDKLPF